jgi:hypothetical protein
MTAPALPSFVDGTLVHQADLNSLVTNLNVFASSVAGKTQTNQYATPLCLVHLTTTQTITTGTETLVVWGATDTSTDNMWTASQASQMTVNTAGTYLIGMSAIFANGLTTSSNTSEARIMVNGTVPSTNTVSCGTTSVYNAGWFVDCAAMATLAAGAVIYFAVAQSSGASGSLISTFGGCHAYAIRLSL